MKSHRKTKRKGGDKPFNLIIRKVLLSLSLSPPLELQSSFEVEKEKKKSSSFDERSSQFSPVFCQGKRLTENWQRASSSTFDIKEWITMNKSSLSDPTPDGGGENAPNFGNGNERNFWGVRDHVKEEALLFRLRVKLALGREKCRRRK